MSVAQEQQSLNPDPKVTLFVLDLTPIGGTDIFYFTAMPNQNDPLYFDGQAYTPIDVEATGFEWDGRGAFPRPKLRIANISGILSASIAAFGDIVGSRFTRIQTFRRFLDDGATPDPNAVFPPEIFIINQRTSQNRVFLEYELASSLDHLGVEIPRRVCIRDVCTHTYRVWRGDDFDYTRVTCPYTESDYYTEKGEATADPSQDKCGRYIRDCKLRFGENNTLPTRAMPGIARV